MLGQQNIALEMGPLKMFDVLWFRFDEWYWAMTHM